VAVADILAELHMAVAEEGSLAVEDNLVEGEDNLAVGVADSQLEVDTVGSALAAGKVNVLEEVDIDSEGDIDYTAAAGPEEEDSNPTSLQDTLL
jgi:hypothetical protein